VLFLFLKEELNLETMDAEIVVAKVALNKITLVKEKIQNISLLKMRNSRKDQIKITIRIIETIDKIKIMKCDNASTK
jgi:hypothetical protein